ncbi:hypothetical protein IAT38_003347 [Cryptococcus sp. DSM 104549]
MRLFLYLIPAFALLPTLFAAPLLGSLLGLIQQQAYVTKAITITGILGLNLKGYIVRILADPVLELSPYNNSTTHSTFPILPSLTKSLDTALSDLHNIPTLVQSGNPTSALLTAYGPLVQTVTATVFSALIDVKLLVNESVGKDLLAVPDVLNLLDDDLTAIVKALESSFKGITAELAKAVGKDTPLAIALKTLGGDLFGILFPSS